MYICQIYKPSEVLITGSSFQRHGLASAFTNFEIHATKLAISVAQYDRDILLNSALALKLDDEKLTLKASSPGFSGSKSQRALQQGWDTIGDLAGLFMGEGSGDAVTWIHDLISYTSNTRSSIYIETHKEIVEDSDASCIEMRHL